MQPSDVRRITRNSRTIEGWFFPGAAALFGLLDEVHHAEGVFGNLFEIGVHHGKSAVLLCAMARPAEVVGVCDLFGQQRLNTSTSGRGDRALFESNVARVALGFDRLKVIERSSLSLTPAQVGSPQRLFHIDGGHRYEEALSDLSLAASVLHPRGAIILDDPFRPEWPGVTEALLHFLSERTDFAPVVLGFNKIVITRQEAYATYWSALIDESAWAYFDRNVYHTKTLPVAGRDTIIIYIPYSRQLPWIERAVARAWSYAARVKHELGRLGTVK